MINLIPSARNIYGAPRAFMHFNFLLYLNCGIQTALTKGSLKFVF